MNAMKRLTLKGPTARALYGLGNENRHSESLIFAV